MIIRHFVWAVLLVLLPYCRSGSHQEKPVLTIAAASSTMHVLKELVTAFSEQTGIQCEMVFGSSGKLTSQLLAGAPFDLFLSADIKYPYRLLEAGLALDSPMVYAYGQVILWSAKMDVQPSMDTSYLKSLGRIAIPNPAIAPYGQAAIQALRHHELDEIAKPKLVYGESVSQTIQFILTGSVDAGITSLSSVHALQDMPSPWMLIDTEAYLPIGQTIILLKRDGDQKRKGAGRFRDFLLTKEGKGILERHGYLLPDSIYRNAL